LPDQKFLSMAIIFNSSSILDLSARKLKILLCF
jgi:hypothetical protein